MNTGRAFEDLFRLYNGHFAQLNVLVKLKCRAQQAKLIFTDMTAYDSIKEYPFLSTEEFQDACHFLDRKYIGATLGPLRRTYKFRLNRNLASGEIYISIMRPIDTSKYEITLDLENIAWNSEDVVEEDACMDLDAENEDLVREMPFDDSLLTCCSRSAP